MILVTHLVTTRVLAEDMSSNRYRHGAPKPYPMLRVATGTCDKSCVAVEGVIIVQDTILVAEFLYINTLLIVCLSVVIPRTYPQHVGRHFPWFCRVVLKS